MTIHPIRRGALVKVKTLHLTITGIPYVLGHTHPESVYWNPNWASMEVGKFVQGTKLGGSITGLVIQVHANASVLAVIPDIYKEDAPWTIYRILIGDDPPLWYPWRDVELLKEDEE